MRKAKVWMLMAALALGASGPAQAAGEQAGAPAGIVQGHSTDQLRTLLADLGNAYTALDAAPPELRGQLQARIDHLSAQVAKLEAGDQSPGTLKHTQEGLDGILELLKLLGQFFPFIGPIVGQVVDTLAKFASDLALVQQIIGLFGTAQNFLDALKGINGLNALGGILGKGGSLYNDLNRMTNQFGVTLPELKVDTVEDIAKAAQQAKAANIKGAVAGMARYLNDPEKTRTGISKYTDPNAALGDVQGMRTEAAAADQNNRVIDMRGTSAEARQETTDIAKKSDQIVKDTVKQGEGAKLAALGAKTTLGIGRIQAALLAEGNKVNALNGAQITSSLKSIAKSSDANQQMVGELVRKTVEDRLSAANTEQQQSELHRATVEEKAQENAVVTGMIGRVTKLGDLGPESLGLPEPGAPIKNYTRDR